MANYLKLSDCQSISFSSNFPPFKLVAVTVKMKISVEREDGEKTEVEKTKEEKKKALEPIKFEWP